MASHPYRMTSLRIYWGGDKARILLESGVDGQSQRVTSSDLYGILSSGYSEHAWVSCNLESGELPGLFSALTKNQTLTGVVMHFQEQMSYKLFQDLLVNLHSKVNLEHLSIIISENFDVGNAPTRLISTLNLNSLMLQTEIADVDKLIFAMKRNVNLKNLSIYPISSSVKDRRKIIEFALSRMSVFSFDHISQVELDYIAENLKTNTNLEILQLSAHDHIDLKELGAAMVVNSTLLKLDVKRMYHSNLGVLLRELVHNTTLLELQAMWLEHYEIPDLITLLRNNDMLDQLSIKLVTDEVSDELIRTIATSGLLKLDIRFMSNRPLQVIDPLLEALKRNTSLKYLNIEGSIRAPSSRQLVDFLCANNVIESLSLHISYGALMLSADQIREVASFNSSLTNVTIPELESVAERNLNNREKRGFSLSRSLLSLH